MKVLLVVISLILLSSRFWQDVKHFGLAVIGYGAFSAVHDGRVVSGLIIFISGICLWLFALAALQFTEKERE